MDNNGYLTILKICVRLSCEQLKANEKVINMIAGRGRRAHMCCGYFLLFTLARPSNVKERFGAWQM